MSKYGYSKNGRRFFIEGDTLVAPKGALGKYGIGLNFDWDTKTWWTGKEQIAKEAVAALEGWAVEREDALSNHATFAKLPDGEWGVRVPVSVDAKRVNNNVTVRKSSGETKCVTLGLVATRVEGATLYYVQRKARKAAPRSYSGEYCYHICPVGGFKCCPQNGPCHDCE
jgi:hypothetical protein